MKTMRFGIGWGLLLLTTVPPHAQADVTAYAIFKTAIYHQTNTAPPVAVDAPNAYFFGAQVSTDDNGLTVTNATVTTPNSSVYPLIGPGFFNYDSSYFADTNSFDAAFPGGAYLLQDNNDSDSGSVSYPTNDLYSPVIPAFMTNSWQGLQAVDPTQPLQLCWNSFVPDPNVNAAYIYFRILDNSSDSYVFTLDLIPSDTTSEVVPAYTLKAGGSYTVQLIFSDRILGPDAGYGFDTSAAATVGFDNLTYAPLNTVAPFLTAVPSANGLILSWPVTSSNYVLTASSVLSARTTWTPVNGSPTVVSNQNIVVVPTSLPAQFFSLQIEQRINPARR